MGYMERTLADRIREHNMKLVVPGLPTKEPIPACTSCGAFLMFDGKNFVHTPVDKHRCRPL